MVMFLKRGLVRALYSMLQTANCQFLPFAAEFKALETCDFGKHCSARWQQNTLTVDVVKCSNI